MPGGVERDHKQSATIPLSTRTAGLTAKSYFLALSYGRTQPRSTQSYALRSKASAARSSATPTNACTTAGEHCDNYKCVSTVTGDTCADPIVVSALPFTTANVDITTFANNLEFSSEDVSCTGYINDGRDAFYQVTLAAGRNSRRGQHHQPLSRGIRLFTLSTVAHHRLMIVVSRRRDGEVGESETLDYTNGDQRPTSCLRGRGLLGHQRPGTGLYTLDISAL